MNETPETSEPGRWVVGRGRRGRLRPARSGLAMPDLQAVRSAEQALTHTRSHLLSAAQQLVRFVNQVHDLDVAGHLDTAEDLLDDAEDALTEAIASHREALSATARLGDLLHDRTAPPAAAPPAAPVAPHWPTPRSQVVADVVARAEAMNEARGPVPHHPI